MTLYFLKIESSKTSVSLGWHHYIMRHTESLSIFDHKSLNTISSLQLKYSFQNCITRLRLPFLSSSTLSRTPLILHTQLPSLLSPYSLFSHFSLLLAGLALPVRFAKSAQLGLFYLFTSPLGLRKHACQHAYSCAICTALFTRPSLSSPLTEEMWLL